MLSKIGSRISGGLEHQGQPKNDQSPISDQLTTPSFSYAQERLIGIVSDSGFSSASHQQS